MTTMCLMAACGVAVAAVVVGVAVAVGNEESVLPLVPALQPASRRANKDRAANPLRRVNINNLAVE
jgi:hypothetical protein